LLIRLKTIIIVRMLIQSNTISIKASPGILNLKNRKLQIKLRSICIVNTINALALSCPNGDFQIRNNDMPIKRYRHVQTGAKR